MLLLSKIRHADNAVVQDFSRRDLKFTKRSVLLLETTYVQRLHVHVQ